MNQKCFHCLKLMLYGFKIRILLNLHHLTFKQANCSMSTSLSAQFLTVAVIALQRQLYHQRGLNLNPDLLNPNSWLKPSYDFIIVGGGTAGSILASRLSACSNQYSVLLLEAGGPVSVITDIVPLNYRMDTAWNYRTVPQRYSAFGIADRRINYPRGRILGGSSSTNYAMYIRGNRRGFDEYEQRFGASGWNYENFLKYFIISENNTDPEVVRANPGFHGTAGPVQVSTVPNIDPIFSRWNSVARRSGWNSTDVNGPDQYGSVVLQATQSPLNWTRQSAYNAYIEPIILERQNNLQVVVNAHVTRILFDHNYTKNTPTAVGVEFVLLSKVQNKTFTVKTRKEVIISGGTVNSPQILMLSGIGPKEHLKEVGVSPLIADLPGVGSSLSEHFIVPFDFLLDNQTELGWTSGSDSLSTVQNFYNFFVRSYGPLTRYPGLEMYIASGVNGDRDWPDGMLYLVYNQKYYDLETSINYYDSARRETWRQYLTPLIGNQRNFHVEFGVFRPLSKGTIRLASADPFEYPLIDPNYFSNRQDLVALLQIMSIGLRLTENPELQEVLHFYAPIPGCTLCSGGVPLSRCYSYLACAATSFTGTTSHPVGSCRMGNGSNNTADPESLMAVVDERLRVKGVSALRVVDASVMPLVPNANTMAATMALAERAAQIIKEDYNCK